MTYQFSSQYSNILELPIADGLKELLIDYGFTQQRIVRTESTDFASILGIDDYLAEIIYNAAKRKT
jgi:hypothetical protein